MGATGATAGLDIGSTATKVAIVAGDGRILFRGAAATGANPRRAAEKLLAEGLARAGLSRGDLRRVISTGYGRRLVSAASGQVSEITANARGAVRLAGGPGRVRTVIDVGGQDSKVISLDESGRVAGFAMNDKCAAGTGRFLEVIARALELPLDELGRMALRSTRRLQINSTCTVFAESEVVSLLAAGEPVEDIAAAVHLSVARRVAALAMQAGVMAPVLFDGGPAMNAGLVKSLSVELGEELIVPEEPQTATALGAALVALEGGGEAGG